MSGIKGMRWGANKGKPKCMLPGQGADGVAESPKVDGQAITESFNNYANKENSIPLPESLPVSSTDNPSLPPVQPSDTNKLSVPDAISESQSGLVQPSGFTIGIGFQDNLNFVDFTNTLLPSNAQVKFSEPELIELKRAWGMTKVGKETNNPWLYIAFTNAKHILPKVIFNYDYFKKSLDKKFNGLFDKIKNTISGVINKTGFGGNPEPKSEVK